MYVQPRLLRQLASLGPHCQHLRGNCRGQVLTKTRGGHWQFLPGSLAVWLGIKYPNLFAAALGRRASLQAKIDFYTEYALRNEKSFFKQVNYLNKGSDNIQRHPNVSWVYGRPARDLFHKRILTAVIHTYKHMISERFLPAYTVTASSCFDHGRIYDLAISKGV